MKKDWRLKTKQELEEIIKTSKNYKQVLEKLGYSTCSANNKVVKAICEKYNFNISHFNHTTLKDLTNQRFGRLTVLYRDNSKESGHQKKSYWICKCDCGKITSVNSSSLISGKTQSCGCLRADKTSEALSIDLTNQRFGKLTAIKRVESIEEASGQIRTAWLCRCDCGHEIIVKTINLRSGDTKSCGCIYSKGEYLINNILNNLNINFKREYAFKDLLTKKNFVMRFDFAIFDKNNELKCLIEYQGNGHYIESNWDVSLKERQERDNKKREYCKEHNIPLIEIPYWDYDKINEEYIKERLDEYCN